MVCLLDTQCTGPLSHWIYPDREREWKRGTSVAVLRLVDWSCGPQFASVSPVRDVIGN